MTLLPTTAAVVLFGCLAATASAQGPASERDALRARESSPWPSGHLVDGRQVVVAHVRIDRTQPAVSCRQSTNALHTVRVLSRADGAAPATMSLEQSDGGTCLLDGGQTFTQGEQYRPGDEFIAFLVQKDDRSFVSVAGAATLIRVRDGRVARTGWGPIRKGTTVAEAWAALASPPR